MTYRTVSIIPESITSSQPCALIMNEVLLLQKVFLALSQVVRPNVPWVKKEEVENDFIHFCVWNESSKVTGNNLFIICYSFAQKINKTCFCESKFHQRKKSAETAKHTTSSLWEGKTRVKWKISLAHCTLTLAVSVYNHLSESSAHNL